MGRSLLSFDLKRDDVECRSCWYRVLSAVIDFSPFKTHSSPDLKSELKHLLLASYGNGPGRHLSSFPGSVPSKPDIIV